MNQHRVIVDPNNRPGGPRLVVTCKTANKVQFFDAETLTMAAFRDSSEIEFGTDDAYILTTGKEPSERVLKHLKSRNGEGRDIELEFDGAVQRFSGTFIDDVVSQAESWWQK